MIKTPEIFGEGTQAITSDNLNKDKLIYELGKDGANTVIKFLDEIAHYKA